MGGIGSGRRVTRDEVKHQQIIDKAWGLVEELMDSQAKERFQAAKDIVVKDITQHVKGEGFGTKVFINNIKSILDKAYREKEMVADTSRSGDRPATSS